MKQNLINQWLVSNFFWKCFILGAPSKAFNWLSYGKRSAYDSGTAPFANCSLPKILEDWRLHRKLVWNANIYFQSSAETSDGYVNKSKYRTAVAERLTVAIVMTHKVRSWTLYGKATGYLSERPQASISRKNNACKIHFKDRYFVVISRV